MKYIFTLFYISLAVSLMAQGPNAEGFKDKVVEMKTFEEKLDSAVLSYFVAKSIERKRTLSKELDSLFIPEFSDSVLENRLKEINSLILLDYNDRTKAFINMYTRKKRTLVPYILGLSDYYFPIFEAELDKREMPLELKYVPVIESALKPRAVSRAGAVGLWQFMYPTAKMNGLTITSYVDERKDPLKATEAACKYLGDLYGMFGDWQLAIAAYNCGPGNVRKAIRRSGGKTNFWEIYNYLPRETRGYVPAFIAAVYFFNYHEEHNIGIEKIDMPLVVDTVMIEDYVHLNDIANQFNIDLNLVRELNPQYRVDIVPASKTRPYAVILPMEYSLVFSEAADTLYKQYIARKGTRTSSPVNQSSSNYSIAGKTAVYYTVKSGDNLGYIADWYDTYVSSLKSWNGMYSTRIRVGQRIKVYVANEKVNYYSAINNMTFDEKKNISSHSSFSSNSSTGSKGDYVYYTFKSGDTLWDLTQKYPGNSIHSIMSLNGISNARNLKPGQQIKLKKI
ncbi:MAG: transglycosylase SLT domain-containing protein [Bacteroidia bacterium]